MESEWRRTCCRAGDLQDIGLRGQHGGRHAKDGESLLFGEPALTQKVVPQKVRIGLLTAICVIHEELLIGGLECCWLWDLHE